jgi:beta-glucanase (GH16 family)
MNRLFATVLSVAGLLPLACNARPVNTTAEWVLVWADEFDRDGSPDPQKWTLALGGDGWGNQELQYYTARSPQNVVVQQGHLMIRALRESYTGPDGVTRMYTSARLHTQHRFSTTYGRVEARIKLPEGKGLWPAFWMLGDNFGDVGWPACGEIDIMEHVGSEPGTIHGAIHGPGYAQRRSVAHVSTAYLLPSGQRFADDFHLFSIEWDQGVIRFYVDEFLYGVVTGSSLPSGAAWSFDHAFFLLLNVAVGGEWPGPPDASTTFPQVMQVDYVRVYRRRSASTR